MFILYLLLVKKNYSSENAYLLFDDVKERIYNQYPNIRDPNNNEPIIGATIYISEIAKKYNELSSQNAIPILDNVEIESREASPQSRGNFENFAIKIKDALNEPNLGYEEEKVIISIMNRVQPIK